jgi:hypothetical protein
MHLAAQRRRTGRVGLGPGERAPRSASAPWVARQHRSDTAATAAPTNSTAPGGGVTRLRGARDSQWKIRPTTEGAAMCSALVDEWGRTLRRLRVRVAPFPSASSQPDRVLWLPQSAQVVLVVDRLDRVALGMAGELDFRVGDRGHDDLLGLTANLRIVLGLPDGTFFGYRCWRAVHADAIDLSRCDQCRQWSFALASGTRQCRCCGWDGVNALVARFTNTLAFDHRWNA